MGTSSGGYELNHECASVSEIYVLPNSKPYRQL